MNSPLPNGAVSLVARSPDLDHQAIELVVTAPTFRRPVQILRTLESIRLQDTKRRVAVILIENDSEAREGAAAASPMFEDGAIQGLVIVAHERGNCSAYNAGWSTALMQFPSFTHLLVIDDDEIAEPGWIEAMLEASRRFDADITGGPQVPMFEAPAATGIATHPVFAPPYAESGPAPALYSSGNLAIRRRVLEGMAQPFLDTRFNFLGGGDSDFLSRASAKGFRLGWCAEARVVETVPARRLEADWIRKRSVRNGVISTLVEQRRRQGDRLGPAKVAARSLALLAAAPFRALARLARTGSRAEAVYPVHVGLGRVLAHFGYEHEQYREPEKN